MGAFARDFYEASPYLLLPISALGLFGAAFIAVTIRAMLLGSAGADQRARIALEDDVSKAPHGEH